MEKPKPQVTQPTPMVSDKLVSNKRVYEKPRLSRFGRLADITRSVTTMAGSDGEANKTG